jgi:hypothetical protein
MSYHVSWATKDGDFYENEYTTLAEVAEVVLAMSDDTEITIKPPGWSDQDDDEADEVIGVPFADDNVTCSYCDEAAVVDEAGCCVHCGAARLV